LKSRKSLREDFDTFRHDRGCSKDNLSFEISFRSLEEDRSFAGGVSELLEDTPGCVLGRAIGTSLGAGVLVADELEEVVLDLALSVLFVLSVVGHPRDISMRGAQAFGSDSNCVLKRDALSTGSAGLDVIDLSCSSSCV